jgi:hypothetical protein
MYSVVRESFATLLEDNLKGVPDVSQTLCVSILQKGRQFVPEDAHNHIHFLVSQDPNLNVEDIGGCPYGKVPVLVEWGKPWYLIYIWDWTCEGNPPRLCDPVVEQYPKRYCPNCMNQNLLEQFYAEFDCGEQSIVLDDYDWGCQPRGLEADCRLVRN